MTDIGIIEAVRTPRGMGKSSGALNGVKPVNLLAGLLTTVRFDLALDIEQIADGVFGCVTQTSEQGGNIGKIACQVAGWSPRMSAVTINRYCASGLSAVNFASQQAQSMGRLVVAGGLEMMSRVPMSSDDSPLTHDAETIAAIGFAPVPWTADLVASRHGISREDCDRYAALSQSRAAAARQAGVHRSMRSVIDAEGRVLLDHDENIRETSTFEKLSSLKPIYASGADALDAQALEREPALRRREHVHTAGNAPCTADGAAVVVLGPIAEALRLRLPVRARIVAHADACVAQVQTGAVDATRLALAKAGLGVGDIGVWEVRDSFAAITLHYLRALAIPLERFNVNGSSIALGHPIGATGAMLVSCLLDEMERRGERYGVAAITGASGVATATVFERLSL